MLLAVQILELFSLVNILHIPQFPKSPEMVTVLQSNGHTHEKTESNILLLLRKHFKTTDLANLKKICILETIILLSISTNIKTRLVSPIQICVRRGIIY